MGDSLSHLDDLLNDAMLQMAYSLTNQGPVSRKSRKRFGSEKPFAKLGPAFSDHIWFILGS